jgi:hypothetical protein
VIFQLTFQLTLLHYYLKPRLIFEREGLAERGVILDE